MKIILTGFMGAGKSSVAAKVAEVLGLEKVEMDDLVLRKSGRQDVNEIFAEDGEKHFRKLEAEVAQELSRKDKVVIATGGGIGINKKILASLDGTVIFLDTPLKIIKERLQGDNSRPLFKDQQKAEELFNKRLPLYRQNADYIILTGGKDVGEVAHEIVTNILFKCGGGRCVTCPGCH